MDPAKVPATEQRQLDLETFRDGAENKQSRIELTDSTHLTSNASLLIDRACSSPPLYPLLLDVLRLGAFANCLKEFSRVLGRKQSIDFSIVAF